MPPLGTGVRETVPRRTCGTAPFYIGGRSDTTEPHSQYYGDKSKGDRGACTYAHEQSARGHTAHGATHTATTATLNRPQMKPSRQGRRRDGALYGPRIHRVNNVFKSFLDEITRLGPLRGIDDVSVFDQPLTSGCFQRGERFRYGSLATIPMLGSGGGSCEMQGRRHCNGFSLIGTKIR